MMFSASQFDGGFTASQSRSFSDIGPSPVKSRDSYGVVPVTVKQISQASRSGDDKSNYQIDGSDVTNVKMAGIVSDLAEKVTDITFILDDGTGRIGCKRWLNDPFDKKQMEDIKDGMYVRLIGHLKSFQDKPDIVAFSVWPITNFDEITHHFIECVHSHLQKSVSQIKGGSGTQSQMLDSSQSTPGKVKEETKGFQSTPPNQFSVQMSVDGLKPVDQRVLDYLQQPSSLAQEKGVHRDDIARHLNLPVEKIMECITALEDEGLIYSTIDEYHFKSTAS